MLSDGSGGTTNVTSPTELLVWLHDTMHLRWGGIRKPRTYSNIDYSKDQGWLLPPQFAVRQQRLA